MILGSRKMFWIGYNFRNKRGMHHHLLVLLHLETKMRIIARIHKTSKLDQQSLKEVWHREVVGIFYVLSLVEPTQVNVMMAR